MIELAAAIWLSCLVRDSGPAIDAWLRSLGMSPAATAGPSSCPTAAAPACWTRATGGGRRRTTNRPDRRPVNAGLNSIATMLLIIGRLLIKQGRVEAHRKVMLSAFGVSALFLTFYVAHKASKGFTNTTFNVEGVAKAAYLVLLSTHLVLAMAVPVLAILLIRWGLRNERARHRRLARGPEQPPHGSQVLVRPPRDCQHDRVEPPQNPITNVLILISTISSLFKICFLLNIFLHKFVPISRV